MEQNEHFCKDCKHFAQYYSLYRAHFYKLDKGSCSKIRNANKSEVPADTAGCDNYEPKEDIIIQLKNQIRYCIKQIERNTEYLNWFLNNDE